MLDEYYTGATKDVAQSELNYSSSDRAESVSVRQPDRARVGQAIQRTCTWLLNHQHADGYWCAELEGDTILESEYILLLTWLGREQSEVAKKAANYILKKQLPSGGWAMHPGGQTEISGSVKAYFALKLTGHPPTAEYMQRARQAILKHGGADAVNSFTRFYLALLGQIPYKHCPAVPPEAVLLPAWFPINIYRISAWSRTILVPLAIMWARKPQRQLDEHQGINELFIRQPEDWPALHCPGLEKNRGWLRWDRIFRQLDRALKLIERLRLRPLRRIALKRAERWMLQRFENSDGVGAIFPPIIWSVVALKSLGYRDDSEEVLECLRQLEQLIIEEEDTVRLQPCKSPVWDTAIALRALAAAGSTADDPMIEKSIDWLISKEVRQVGDWRKTVKAEPGGWYFEHNNAFYPDVDDTIMVMMALSEQAANTNLTRERVSVSRGMRNCSCARSGVARLNSPEGTTADSLGRKPQEIEADGNSSPDGAAPTDTFKFLSPLRGFRAVFRHIPWGLRPRLSTVAASRLRGKTARPARSARLDKVAAACERGEHWILAMQNRDGGWGAFDKDNDAEFLCHVPFADHNAMIDPSTPDIAARVVECLAQFEMSLKDEPIDRAITYIRQSQLEDGSWYGRWGVNYIYGTWQVLVGLSAVGIPEDDPAIERGAQWLIDHQQECGGWGESADSYADPSLAGIGPVTASQTSWALLGLMAAGKFQHPAVERGIQYLIDTQQDDGSWLETEFTGTGFPLVFYLRYHMYPIYFPLLALAKWERSIRSH